VAIADALKQNCCLKDLNLDHNNTGHEGGEALGAALKVNRSLTSLYLENNNIGYKGGKALADALKENQFLTSLKCVDLDSKTLFGNELHDL